MKQTKSIFKKVITDTIKAKGNNEVLSEAAFPAYAHKNPLIDHIFWKRLNIAKSFITKPEAKVLDFGCGSGVFGYDLSVSGHSLTLLDIDLSPFKEVMKLVDFPEELSFIECEIRENTFRENSFDYVVALDVLEHMDDNELRKVLEILHKILKPGGDLIISGPTENILYKIGRRISGREFTGGYHESDIKRVRKIVQQYFEIDKLKMLAFLFEVSSFKKNS